MKTTVAVAITTLSLALGGLCGCAHVANHFEETGPSTTMEWQSPTAQDVRARFEPDKPRERDWPPTEVAMRSGVVYHWPLYFEDPFVVKGHGRTDQTHPHNVYRGGWESYIAMPYNAVRFAANTIFLPISAIVTPPWTVMESDGKISKQLVWYDHDAVPVWLAEHRRAEAARPEASESAPASESKSDL